MKRLLLAVGLLLGAIAIVESCGYDDSLREYLTRRFWLPFAKNSVPLERRNVRRVSAPFAGMRPLLSVSGNMRAVQQAYQAIPLVDGSDYIYGIAHSPVPPSTPFDAVRRLLETATKDASLTAAQKEELALLDAKIDMRQAEIQHNDSEMLKKARQKLQAFLRGARNAGFASEARGWIAHIFWLEGDRTAAGKMYLDELNRDGSNLSRETLLNSLQMVYRYDGGADLRAHIEDYFDTPEHALFAVQLVTNPHLNRTDAQIEADAKAYRTILRIAEQRRSIFESASRSEELTTLLMRTALRMGDPQEVLKITGMLPADSPLFDNADVNWMKASAHFVTGDVAAAESPLLKIFQNKASSADEKAAAAYGLAGVYFKLHNPVEQLRYALWLAAQQEYGLSAWNSPGGTSLEDRTLYFARSGWDLAAMLDYQLSDEVLADFVQRYPNVPQLRLVRYAQAVRLARADRYGEAADTYASINSGTRAARMRQLAKLFARIQNTALNEAQRMESHYEFAEFLSSNSERVYFNDTLWDHFQNFALIADSDARLTNAERETLIATERKVRDDQEERWRAYLTLNDVVKQAGKTPLGRKSAQLALRCLRGISSRFGRTDEIREADIRLTNWLR